MSEVPMEERMAIMGETVTDDDRAFHAARRTFNVSVGIERAVDILSMREMRAFWDAAKEYALNQGVEA